MRLRQQPAGPAGLRLVATLAIALAIATAYWILIPLITVAMIAKQWL